MRRQMIWCACFYCLGLLAAARSRLPYHALYTLCVFFLGAGFLLCRRPRLCSLCAALIFFLLAMLMYLRQQQPPGAGLRRVVAYHPDGLYTLEGVVVSEPLPRRGRTVFMFAAHNVRGQGGGGRCRERVRVAYAHPPWFAVGDRLAVTGRLKLSTHPALVSVDARCSIVGQGSCRWYWVGRQASSLRSRLRSRILSRLRGPCAALLCGMLLGDKESIPGWIREELSRSGTAHILVISGFHVGFLGFLFMLAGRLVGIPRAARRVGAALFLVFYCVLTGASVSVVRATCMAILFLAGHPLKRECELLHLIACSALIILVVSPQEFFRLRFQLSFSSVTAIALVYPRLSARIPAQIGSGRLTRYLVQNAAVSAAAWAGTAGLIARSFRIISPIAICANLIIIPLAGLLITSGIIFLAVSSFAPAWSSPFAASTRTIAAILLYANELILRTPGAYWRI